MTGRNEIFARIPEAKAWNGVAFPIKRDRASKRFMNVPRLTPHLMPCLLNLKAMAVVYMERIAGALKKGTGAGAPNCMACVKGRQNPAKVRRNETGSLNINLHKFMNKNNYSCFRQDRKHAARVQM